MGEVNLTLRMVDLEGATVREVDLGDILFSVQCNDDQGEYEELTGKGWPIERPQPGFFDCKLREILLFGALRLRTGEMTKVEQGFLSSILIAIASADNIELSPKGLRRCNEESLMGKMVRAAEIRKLHAHGMKYESIAAELGCSAKTVQRALRD